MTAVLIASLFWLGASCVPAAAQAPAAPASAAPASAAVQPPGQAGTPDATAPAASSAVRAASSRVAAKNNNNKQQVTKPLWRELTPAQQQALAPLAGKWDTVSEAQKRKWLALSQNFPRMSGAEQAKLHSRMSEWAALSPQQRTQARLNFGETQQLSADDKKAKWEAYQALPPEEKRKLAASAAKPPATAAAIKPVPADKLAEIPKPKPPATAAAVKPASTERSAGVPKPSGVAKTPRIAAEPGQVNNNTLLPQPAP
ncbi:MAG TPA: DUF3106 domain-containing protein, partial [Ramlibacter sp.]|nr:DUF3106 domain-containing protein [Ramlibacter sp.]